MDNNDSMTRPTASSQEERFLEEEARILSEETDPEEFLASISADVSAGETGIPINALRILGYPDLATPEGVAWLCCRHPV
jgi:hypothetical protein